MLGVAPGFPFECARPYPPGAPRVGPRLSSVACAVIGKAEKNLCIAELGLTLSSELNSAGRRRLWGRFFALALITLCYERCESRGEVARDLACLFLLPLRFGEAGGRWGAQC